MKIKEMQERVDHWIKRNTNGYWKPSNMMLRLMEEVGELARAVNLVYGEKPGKKGSMKKQDIQEEFGDVLFTITCIANALDIDMQKSFTRVMDKYSERDKTRHLNQ